MSEESLTRVERATSPAAYELKRDTVRGDPAAGFVLRLGRALHASGYAAHSLEEVLVEVSRRLGLLAQFFTTPTSIQAAFGPIEQQRVHLIRVEPSDVNLSRLAELDAVTREVLDGKVDAAEGSTRVEAISAAPGPYPWFVRVLGYGIASAAACQFLGGGLREIGLAAGLGLLTGLLALVFRRMTITSIVFELSAALVASLGVSLAAAWGARVSVSTTTLAGIIVLVPGLTVTVAMTELASKHLVSGTARLTGALLALIAIAFGVAVGSTLGEALAGAPAPFRPERLPDWARWVALGIAPIGFTLLLRARPRDVGWVFAASLLGFGAMRLASRGLGPEVGAALGALAVGLASNVYERRRLGPATIPVVPGVLLLVPGSLGYRGLVSLLDEEILVGIDAAFTMVVTALALAAGLLVANVLVPPRK